MEWGGFGPLIAPYAPTCSEPLIEQHARFAAIEFFSYTKAWQAELDPLTADGVLTSFAMVLPSDSQLEKLLSVSITDSYGNVADANVKTSIYGAKLARLGSRELLAYTLDRVSLSVLPAQPIAATIVATVALKPSITAATLPDNLFAQYGIDIASGALSTLMAMANKPWTDITSARIADAQFTNAKAVTSRQVERGFANSGRQSATRWF